MPAPTVYALKGGHWEVVKGIRRWVRDPEPVPTNLCGTDAGYYHHRYGRKEPCGPCADAHKVAEAEREAAKPHRRPRRPVAVCGTESGRKKHVREGTEICDECKAAHSAATGRRRERARAARKANQQPTEIRRAA